LKKEWLEFAVPTLLFIIIRYILEISIRIIVELIFSLIILLSGFLISIIFPLRKSPFYAIMTEYIENKIITTFFFGNKGFDTIKKDDIIEADPLAVYIEDGVIIGIPRIEFANPINKFKIKLSKDQKSFKINFDYIAKNEGAIIKFNHSIKNNRKPNVKLRGVIKGYGPPKKYWLPTTRYTIFYATMFFICNFFIINGIKLIIMGEHPLDYIFGVPYLIIFTIASISFYRYFYYGILRPKGFKGTSPGSI